MRTLPVHERGAAPRAGDPLHGQALGPRPARARERPCPRRRRGGAALAGRRARGCRRRSWSCGPGSSGGWPRRARRWRRSRAAARRFPTSTRRCGSCPSAAARARTGAARSCSSRAADARPAIERWYRRRARAEIAPRLDAASAQAGLAYTGLDIRGQRTRWASCSSRGRMSFNWRLLLAPERVLEYVVWHEVCHLEVLDHSPRFWALLGTPSARAGARSARG